MKGITTCSDRIIEQYILFLDNIHIISFYIFLSIIPFSNFFIFFLKILLF